MGGQLDELPNTLKDEYTTEMWTRSVIMTAVHKKKHHFQNGCLEANGYGGMAD